MTMPKTGRYTPDEVRRNLNPHKPARAAMYLWGAEYARQGGGSMDFWDNLPPARKRLARDLVRDILRAPDERRETRRCERCGARTRPETAQETTECHLCKQTRLCTYLKTSHVPIYAWVCPDCRDKWTTE